MRPHAVPERGQRTQLRGAEVSGPAHPPGRNEEQAWDAASGELFAGPQVIRRAVVEGERDGPSPQTVLGAQARIDPGPAGRDPIQQGAEGAPGDIVIRLTALDDAVQRQHAEPSSVRSGGHGLAYPSRGGR